MWLRRSCSCVPSPQSIMNCLLPILITCELALWRVVGNADPHPNICISKASIALLCCVDEFYSPLCLQPLVFGYTVDWYKRDYERCLSGIILERCIFAVGLFLTHLEAARSTEHYIYYAYVSQ